MPTLARSLLRSRRGQSTVEVLIASFVLAITVQMAVIALRTASRSNVADLDRAFATEKALQMFEELRALVSDEKSSITVLDPYGDGYGLGPAYLPNYKFTLTTKFGLTHDSAGNTLPDASTATLPISGNPIRTNGFVYLRHIDIRSNTLNAKTSRNIWVRVFKATSNAGKASALNYLPTATTPKQPLAEIYGQVHSLGSQANSKQVVDLYVIAVESVPGWWNRLSQALPIMQGALVAAQSRNPGLEFRPHWINTMSYGRDLEYTPEINDPATLATAAGALKKAYVYPGYLTFDDGPDYWYMPGWFSARMNIGAVSVTNTGYAIADQWNHAMREPDEENLYSVLCNIADNNGSPRPEPSYRLLLEGMNSGDARFRNAILLNMHGELIPVPPLRNYSDAAKDPGYYMHRPGLIPQAFRAVTHPERLVYNTSITAQSQPALDVYAWDALPDATDAWSNTTAGNDMIDVITLFIPGASVSNMVQVESVQGDSKTAYYRHIHSNANWHTTVDAFGSTIAAYDGASATPYSVTGYAGTFIADNYTPLTVYAGVTWTASVARSSGLRIRLWGVTPSARPYSGPAYQ